MSRKTSDPNAALQTAKVANERRYRKASRASPLPVRRVGGAMPVSRVHQSPSERYTSAAGHPARVSKSARNSSAAPLLLAASMKGCRSVCGMPSIRHATRHQLCSEKKAVSAGRNPLALNECMRTPHSMYSDRLNRALAAAELQRESLLIAPILVELGEHVGRLCEIVRHFAEGLDLEPQHILAEGLARMTIGLEVFQDAADGLRRQTRRNRLHGQAESHDAVGIIPAAEEHLVVGHFAPLDLPGVAVEAQV